MMRSLICDYCVGTHDQMVIILPNWTRSQVLGAVGEVYNNGDKKLLENILGLNREKDKSENNVDSDIVSSENYISQKEVIPTTGTNSDIVSSENDILEKEGVPPTENRDILTIDKIDVLLNTYKHMSNQNL